MRLKAKSGLAIRHHLEQILHDDGTDLDRTRKYRLQIFLRISLPCLAYFLINDILLGSFGTAAVIVVCIVFQALCAFQLEKHGRLESACRYFMISLCLLLGTSHLWDGQMNSMSLWLIPVLPMSAAFLIGTRSAILYHAIASGIVAGAMIISQFIVTKQMLEDTAIQCMAIRLSGMVFFGASGLLSHQANRNQRRLIRAQRAEVDRIRQEHDSAVESKSTFFANISHEIRTPMNGILGMTQHLLSCTLPSRVRESVKTMHGCAEELLGLLNQILELSALEMGDRKREVDVLDLSQELQSQIKELQRENQISSFQFDDPGCEVKIEADRELLQKTIRLIFSFAQRVAINSQVKIQVVKDPYSSTGLGGELAVRYRSLNDQVGLSKSYESVAHHSDASHAASVSLSIAAQLASLMGAQIEVTERDNNGQEQIFLRFIGDQDGTEVSSNRLRTPGNSLVSRMIEGVHGWVISFFQRDHRTERSSILLGVHLLAGPPLLVYIIDAWLYDHSIALTVYLSGTWLWVIAAILNYRSRHTKMAGWLTAVGALFLMAFLNLADGQIRSESLWILPLIPVGALFVMGVRAFYAIFLTGIFIILGVFLESIYLPFEQEYDETFAYVFCLRMVILQIYGGMSVLAAYVSRRYHAQYKNERLDMLIALRASERAHNEKSKFLTNMSHEIRTPMNGILGLAESLVDQGLPQEQHHTITTIHRCGGHLLALLGEVFDLSELSQRAQRLSNVPMNLGVLLQDVQNLFQASARLKNLSMHIEGSNLDLQVMGDPTRLMQVLSNLVGNAIKFSDDGTVVIALTHATSCERNQKDGYDIQIEVRDEGIGIPDSKVDALFSSFVQIEASSGPDRGGTGLGLAISRRLVRAMGGELDVESEIGRGSVFRIRFWLESTTRPQGDSLTNQSVSRTMFIKETTDRTVLIVDDNPINLKVAQMSLERLGYHAKVARNGYEAIEMAEVSKFDAILMDVRMPGIDGIEATRIIRRGQGQSASSPIIAFSADNYEEQKQLCISAGMNAHLAKPFRANDLNAKLQDIWNNTDPDKEAA